MPVQTRSRSDKNAAVLGSKRPRQVPAFLYGLHRHMAPLPADCRGGRRALLPQGVGSEGRLRRRYRKSVRRRTDSPQGIGGAPSQACSSNSIPLKLRAQRPDFPTGRGADSCVIQPGERPYPSADRIKTLALSEVFSSLASTTFLSERERVCIGMGTLPRRDLPQV